MSKICHYNWDGTEYVNIFCLLSWHTLYSGPAWHILYIVRLTSIMIIQGELQLYLINYTYRIKYWNSNFVLVILIDNTRIVQFLIGFWLVFYDEAVTKGDRALEPTAAALCRCRIVNTHNARTYTHTNTRTCVLCMSNSNSILCVACVICKSCHVITNLVTCLSPCTVHWRTSKSIHLEKIFYNFNPCDIF